ncbi:molybdenum cofactor biosynthesis protein MoaE [Kordiimonas pumila]|uniref:Molybdopterin synthase catalytic subunit n=1 Tax=Kordiimonas pumila TaxID=2161677 RepID=A0ABV7D791_9PROT|nr:molybdenum cofactor biosynthesis protein MoaE [Kordiimonas pumila]
MAFISVQENDFDITQEITRLKNSNHAIGAVVSFTGTVRDIGGILTSMELEHYPGMTEKELERIALHAEERWPLEGCCVIHRYGKLYPGDNIVLVITASAHRSAAFEAAEYLMDFLKTRATFWKKETTHTGGKWVDAKEADDDALKRWQ